MLINLLEKRNRILFEEQTMNWKDCIHKGSEPLLEDRSIQSSYVDKMISNVEELGPYIVIAPNIALAHARPEDGVNELALSLLISSVPVQFSEKEEHSASIIFTLAAPDPTSHLSLLSDLALIFSEPSNIEKLSELRTTQEVFTFLRHSLGGTK